MAQDLFKTNRRQTLGFVLGSGALIVASCAAAQTIRDMHISRDAGCGCCAAWTDIMRRSGSFRVTLTNAPDMSAVKRQLGVPGDLGSCHTATVGGFVIEGHVPLADILRLLETNPAGIRGLAVPGMPMGSPGMEQPGMGSDAFDVVAFGADGVRSVFARHVERS